MEEVKKTRQYRKKRKSDQNPSLSNSLFNNPLKLDMNDDEGIASKDVQMTINANLLGSLRSITTDERLLKVIVAYLTNIYGKDYRDVISGKTNVSKSNSLIYIY